MLVRVKGNCNQRCFFCSFDEKKEGGNPGRDQWLKSIGQERLVQISGGEPLLCDPVELISFCAELVRKGRRIELQTNGVLIDSIDRSLLKKLISVIKISGGYFNINFSSPDAACDFKITGLKGAFDRRLRGVKLLKRLGSRIRLTCVINSRNYRVLPACAGLFIRLKPDLVQFSFVKGIGKASGRRNVIPAYERVSPYLQQSMLKLEEKKINFEVDHIPCCHLGRFWQKNVDVEKIRRGISGPHLMEKAKTAACRGCELGRLCPGPRKDYVEARVFKKGKIVL